MTVILATVAVVALVVGSGTADAAYPGKNENEPSLSPNGKRIV